MAFYDQLQFGDKQIFQHFAFDRNPAEDAAASAKGAELLRNSPYKDQLNTAQMFIAELQDRGREIPNLISPRLGDTGLIRSSVATKTGDAESARHIVALPLGGRIKLDPWDDTLVLLKAPATAASPDRSKMPFEVTPFEIYLTREATEKAKSSQLRFTLRPIS